MVCGALLGYTACAQPSLTVGVSVPVPSVEVVIHAESDFYEPLTPHGEWVVVGSYGRCWRPRRIEAGWRPYCNGSWQRTDAGWYWVSVEPWAWATYHYGRWDFTDEYGWYWVPRTQWAPAWVSWHEGGGYIGWAPLQPFVTISVSGYVGFDQARISPRAYVFVEQRRFLEPIRPTTVVVNNTTIINKTVIINNTKMVNNTVINEGPATAVVEKASGRKVQAVPVRELRHKEEAVVLAKQPALASTKQKADKTVQTPAPRVTATPATKTVAARAPQSSVKPAAATSEPAAPAKPHEAQTEKSRPVAPAAESKPAPRSEAGAEGNPTAPKRESAEKPDKRVEKAEKPVPHSDKNVQRTPEASGREKPAAGEKHASEPGAREHESKPKE